MTENAEFGVTVYWDGHPMPTKETLEDTMFPAIKACLERSAFGIGVQAYPQMCLDFERFLGDRYPTKADMALAMHRWDIGIEHGVSWFDATVREFTAEFLASRFYPNGLYAGTDGLDIRIGRYRKG